MSEIRVNSNTESFLNREISLFKAAAIFVLVLAATSVILYAVGQKYFWHTPVVQTPQDRGLNYYLALTEREPNKPENWVNLGWYYYQVGEYETALEQHMKALDLNPEHFGALYNAGMTLVQMLEFESAIDHLIKAVEINPNSWEAQLVLGISLMSIEQYAEAEGAFSEALDINRHSADTNFYMGYLLEQINEIDDAIHYYEEALRYDPEHLLANDGMSRIAETN